MLDALVLRPRALGPDGETALDDRLHGVAVTPRPVAISQGVWCDGWRLDDGSHTGGHIVAQGQTYVIFDTGEIACPEHAAERGIKIDFPDPDDTSDTAGSWE